MEIIFKDKVFYIEGQPSVNKVIETINSMLSNTHNFSHFIADGIEVYEEPEKYLSQSLTHINKLEIIVKHMRELVMDLLLTSDSYLKRAVQEIPKLADGFYNNPTEREWSGFEELVDGVDWLNEMTLQIGKNMERPKNWEEYRKISELINIEIKNLYSAVENEDSTLIADIIHYEFLSIFKQLQTIIEKTFEFEEFNHDFN